MKTNSLLTYLLYALLATLLLAAGYKACQMQKEKQSKAAEEKEWQETLRKLYPQSDTTGGGSAYIGNDQTAKQPATVTKDGIEVDQTTPATTNTATQQNPVKTTAPPTTTPKTTTTTTPKTTTAKTVAGAGTGRWEVRAGTFTYKEGARERLEQVIKMGYTSAEISKTPSGKYAVIVLRTNNKDKAIQTGDQLEKRGVDAFVSDRNKKK